LERIKKGRLGHFLDIARHRRGGGFVVALALTPVLRRWRSASASIARTNGHPRR
jgi:hypothetical protein